MCRCILDVALSAYLSPSLASSEIDVANSNATGADMLASCYCRREELAIISAHSLSHFASSAWLLLSCLSIAPCTLLSGLRRRRHVSLQHSDMIPLISQSSDKSENSSIYIQSVKNFKSCTCHRLPRRACCNASRIVGNRQYEGMQRLTILFQLPPPKVA